MRGVFERPKGSGVWWVCFFDQNGKRRREKSSTEAAAKNLYRKRKKEVSSKEYAPSRRADGAGIRLSELIDDLLEYVDKRQHKSAKDYHIKSGIVRPALGDRSAETLKHHEIESWLDKHCGTDATFNRYRSFLSLAYREGMRKEKVTVNPTKLIERRQERNSRKKFLSRDEYNALRAKIEELHPDCVAEFIFAVHTGMRAGEQYGMTWRQVHADRKTVELPETKNGEPRTVHLNHAALNAIESVRPKQYKPTEVVFPRETKAIDNRLWFNPCLEAVGIDPEGFTWHNLRHTFCSWLAMAGATNRELMEAAGHRSLQMAARYAHLSPAHTASVVDRLVE